MECRLLILEAGQFKHPPIILKLVVTTLLCYTRKSNNCKSKTEGASRKNRPHLKSVWHSLLLRLREVGMESDRSRLEEGRGTAVAPWAGRLCVIGLLFSLVDELRGLDRGPSSSLFRDAFMALGDRQTRGISTEENVAQGRVRGPKGQAASPLYPRHLRNQQVSM